MKYIKVMLDPLWTKFVQWDDGEKVILLAMCIWGLLFFILGAYVF